MSTPLAWSMTALEVSAVRGCPVVVLASTQRARFSLTDNGAARKLAKTGPRPARSPRWRPPPDSDRSVIEYDEALAVATAVCG
ncbi:hypothetical protein ACIBCH_24055 [Amycolatopsis thailandensis]|uniref:hypothetical protein n=1 Tax=Amycolatopsis thailandensis TaxID=589330 RepID=UPI0037A9BD20